MGVIVIYINIQKAFFGRFYIHKNQKNQPFLRKEYIFLKPKYRELSWAIKMEFLIFEKANNSISTKLQVNSLNNCKQDLNCF